MGGEEAASELTGSFMSIASVVRSKFRERNTLLSSEDNMREINLPCYGITIHLDEETGCGTITSGLKEHRRRTTLPTQCSH